MLKPLRDYVVLEKAKENEVFTRTFAFERDCREKLQG